MSAFVAERLGDDARGRWDSLWKRAGAGANPALHWEWIGHAARGVGSAVRIGIRSEKEPALLAGAVFVERTHRRVLTEWRHPAPFLFTGLLTPKPPGEDLQRELLAALDTAIPDGISLAELVFPPGSLDVRGLLWQGWEGHPHFTYQSDIRGPGALHAAAVTSQRRWAERARAEGLRCVFGPAAFTRALALWDATRARKRLVDWTPGEIFHEMPQLEDPARGASDEITSSTPLRLLAGIAEDPATPGALPYAAGLWGVGISAVWHWIGASRRGEGGHGSGASALLHMEVTDLLATRFGRPYLYDWCGANTPSVVQFKKDFRPELSMGLRLLRRRGVRRLLG